MAENLREFIRGLFKCPVCQGTGKIPNPDFEACIANPDVVPEAYRDNPYRCKHCRVKHACFEGEFIRCINCNGTGYLKMGWEEMSNLLERNLEKLVDALRKDGLLGIEDGWIVVTRS